jgi:hypothetical protein
MVYGNQVMAGAELVKKNRRIGKRNFVGLAMNMARITRETAMLSMQ